MGLFNKKNEGGLMDVIRCDQDAGYLVWKWSPNGEQSRKENSIRYGIIKNKFFSGKIEFNKGEKPYGNTAAGTYQNHRSAEPPPAR